ncbi:origin recognition complex subunit 2, putative [Paecilomyces variotii No. 5]|uniref:Origin recognition complex subunit 2 n=1 Tax=Byssochlamys spectabilis (strain No. 5 / NBRC 109023) TaxID=1356009 RepID=V5G956_BYSSN|nr:origin recognition complex subunit 2, putative [Paecilomyces variotii No. 5]
MKRKAPDASLEDDEQPVVSTPKRQKTSAANGYGDENQTFVDDTLDVTPSKRVRTTAQKPKTINGLTPSGLKTPTHKGKAKSLFSTPTKGAQVATPTRVKNADRSAKRKSARVLFEQDDDDIWDGADRLAEEILEDESDELANGERNGKVVETVEKVDGDAKQAQKPADTPKRGRGRPKGAKNKRSPTPEGELPAHERYFFQNRAGPPRTSNNNLSKLSLLTHEEYFEKLAQYEDPHREEKEFLVAVHRRSFPQWNFELDEGFNLCLYGYGSKRGLIQQFADWLYTRSPSPPTIVVVNGYTSGISVRSIFATIVGAVMGADTPSKLGAQPAEVLDLLQSALQSRSRGTPITVLINSIDAPPLRRGASQALLARLAAIPSIHLLATADTTNFSLMWDIGVRDQFNFVFHDCTTFTPYEEELNVVDEVHSLLGRKGRRIGGKEGVGFVLKSLPENARNLYRVLLTELLSTMGEGAVSDEEDDGGEARGRGGGPGEEPGIEFRSLYQKAAEEFIASSEMMFRTLLKEFHDHQMITSRMDGSGTEILGVPLSREEMEGVLEDLVLG